MLKGHERSVYSVSWGRGLPSPASFSPSIASGKSISESKADGDMDVDAKDGGDPAEAEEEHAGWIASTGSDGRINIWNVKVTSPFPHSLLNSSSLIIINEHRHRRIQIHIHQA